MVLEGLNGELFTHLRKCVCTIYEALRETAKKVPKRDFIGHRSVLDEKAGLYVWQTYGKMVSRVDVLASGLADTGVLKPGDNVGIYSENSPERIFSEHACFSRSLRTVPCMTLSTRNPLNMS